MQVDGKSWRTIWREADGCSVGIIDQTRLPHRFEITRLTTLQGAAQAIATMQVRGAPLIGATAAYGLALALQHDASDAGLAHARAVLLATRPTAANLKWALDDMASVVADLPPAQRVAAAYARAEEICEADIAINQAIGLNGVGLLQDIAKRKRPGEPVNILTHCNAGWLATVDRGTATAPIYRAQEQGIPLHVFVDETRPRNQGAALTAWELKCQGVPYTVIADNAGGHLMQHGKVDIMIVGADRVAANGDVANKIGTYLKALAARDNGIAFYVALPSPTIDFGITDGRGIPIEERSGQEVATISGLTEGGRIETVRIVPEGSLVANPAFDVTPAHLVTGLVTERGIVAAEAGALARAFPERAAAAASRLAAE